MPSLPWRVTVTGNSTTFGYPTFVPDTAIRPVSMGIGCTVNSTALTYSIEYTFDDTSTTTWVSTGLTWYSSLCIAAASSNNNVHFTMPVTGIRPNVTSASSTGTLTLTIVPSG